MESKLSTLMDQTNTKWTPCSTGQPGMEWEKIVDNSKYILQKEID